MAQLHRVTIAPGPIATGSIAPGYLTSGFTTRVDYHDRNVARRIAEAMKQKGYQAQVDTIWA
jgi:threonine aldolase